MNKFEINFDIIPIKYKDKHNWIHLFGTALLALIFNIWVYKATAVVLAYGLGLLWEIGDGFKPWFYTFKNIFRYPSWVNWLREELLYSNKFSIQDALVWDLGGAILGYLLITLIGG